MPATSGREPSDQASDASDTPVGHIPPTPIAAKNRESKSCSGVAEKYPSPENREKQKMLAPIDRTRPSRSPNQPNTKPPYAAPNKNAALYQENHRGTIVFRLSASPLSGSGGSPAIFGTA